MDKLEEMQDFSEQYVSDLVVKDLDMIEFGTGALTQKLVSQALLQKDTNAEDSVADDTSSKQDWTGAQESQDLPTYVTMTGRTDTSTSASMETGDPTTKIERRADAEGDETTSKPENGTYTRKIDEKKLTMEDSVPGDKGTEGGIKQSKVQPPIRKNKRLQKNLFQRMFHAIMRSKKKDAKNSYVTTDVGDSEVSANTAEKTQKLSRPHNKRDWIRRHLLCCFVRQTATVTPTDD